MSHSSAQPLTALIVDQDKQVHAKVFQACKQRRIRTVHCRTAAEALGVAQQQHCDLLVTEFATQPLNGVQLAMRLRSKLPHLKVAVYAEDFPVQALKEAESLHFVLLDSPLSDAELASFLPQPAAPDASAAPAARPSLRRRAEPPIPPPPPVAEAAPSRVRLAASAQSARNKADQELELARRLVEKLKAERGQMQREIQRLRVVAQRQEAKLKEQEAAIEHLQSMLADVSGEEQESADTFDNVVDMRSESYRNAL